MGGSSTGALILTSTSPWSLSVNNTNTISLNGSGDKANYAATGAQTVRNTSYTNLTLSGSGYKTLAAFSISGTVSVEGSVVGITAAPTFGANSTLQYKNVGTRTTNASSTLSFTNGTGFTLPASVFSGNVNNFTLNGAGGVTLGGATNIAGALTLTNGTLTTGANTLTYSGLSISRTNGNRSLLYS